MTVQRRNSEMVNLLSADFQPRYEPNFAWKSVVAAFMHTPNNIAVWPISAVRRDSIEDRVRDVNGGLYHLTDNNIGGNFRYENLVPYIEMNGTTAYLDRADGGAGGWADVTGTEAHVLAAQRGLTVGGWFMPGATTANMGVMIKGNNTVNDAYWLYVQPAQTIRFTVWNGGAGTVISHANTYTVDAWQFWVGRFDPSTSLDVYQNGVWTSNVAAIPASIQDSASPFCVGSYSGVGTFYDGRTSIMFLNACYLSDAQVFSMYQQSRALYGV